MQSHNTKYYTELNLKADCSVGEDKTAQFLFQSQWTQGADTLPLEIILTVIQNISFTLFLAHLFHP